MPEQFCEAFVAGGFDPSRGSVVPFGADPAVYRSDGGRADLPTEKSFRFLWVGGTIYTPLAPE